MVIQRALNSENDEAREAGGSLSVFAALEWNLPELMRQALLADSLARKGVASICAGRVDRTSNTELDLDV